VRFAQYLTTVRSSDAAKLWSLGNGYLTYSSVLVKAARITVTIINAVILVKLVGSQQLLNVLNREPVESVHFPMSAMCDYEVRVPARLFRYSHECILQHNPYYVYLLVGLAAWFVIVACLQALAMLRAMLCCLFCLGTDDINTKLMSAGKQGVEDLTEFRQLLGKDGMMLMKLVEEQASADVAACMLATTWDVYTQTKIAPEYGPN